jgi:hypothetical protein
VFRLTSKVKIAAGLAAGALTLGAAGAYAANATNNGTIPVQNLKSVTGGTAGTLTVMSTNGKTSTLTIPATFSNMGQCVSFFAQHQDLVLKPAAGTARISKNSHGKLVSGIKTWCETRLTSATKTDSTDAPDATQTDASSTDSTDSTGTKSGASHGRGHGHGHNPTA